jgi:two-component system phosphate regulon sensor histidine kinase PhoR
MPFRAMLVLADDTSSKRAERMRADFLANASHELRTPLASLAGFIETLAGPARDDEEARERFLGIMQVQTERMRRLIDDLLSLSPGGDERAHAAHRLWTSTMWPGRGGSAHPGRQSRAITLKISTRLTALSYPRRSRSGLRGDREPGAERDEILPRRLHHLCLRRTMGGPATPPSMHAGPARSGLRAADPGRARPRPRSALRRGAVKRSGPASSGAICRAWPSASSAWTVRKAGPASGTGLGLAIVKHIVNRHRGGFTVESAPGVGSVFSVFFPGRRSADRAKPDVTRKASPASTAAQSGRTRPGRYKTVIHNRHIRVTDSDQFPASVWPGQASVWTRRNSAASLWQSCRRPCSSRLRCWC